ncbi:hypothetical protein ACM7KX_30010 [Pseudomonas aeruginosa]
MDEPLFNELLESVKQADQIMSDHAELRRLAKAATPGPWTLYVPEDYQGPEELPGYGVECAEGRAIVWGALEPETGCQFDRDAEFIAAANPQAILKLIAEVEHLRKDAARYRWLRDSCTRQWDVMCRDIEIVINGDGAEDCEDLDGIIDAALEGATQ